MKFILPFYVGDKKYPITQYFGEQYLYGGKMAIHYGVDWAMPKGTPLIAPFSGKVVRVTPEHTTGYGKAVYLLADCQEHGKIEALLAHMSEIKVVVDQIITCGQTLGLSGNSGFWIGVTGYHIHYGLKVNGKYVDPLTFYADHNFQDNNLFNPTNDQEEKPYIVQEGDSLWRIAKKFYGNGAQYMAIYLRNLNVLSNPNVINTGQLLVIPPLKNKGL